MTTPTKLHAAEEPATDPAETAQQLLTLYQEECRGFLESHLAVAVDALDRRAQLLQSVVEVRETLDIGFVGESQVGKSTLLNSLIGEFALPSGGVGPLTAQAIHVRHADDPFFVVRYHSRKKLNEARFAIEAFLGSSDAAAEVEASSGAEKSQLVQVVEEEAGDQGTRRVAQALIKSFETVFGIDSAAGEDGRLAAHCLRAALGQELKAAFELPEEVCQRIEAVSAIIGEERRVEDLGDRRAFLEELRLRAAGWQSPLIAGLQLHLSAGLLTSLHLVDLPGVGTINDPSQQETKDFVRSGDALAIVVRNNGITEAVVNLLERSEFISRWVWAAGEETPPIHAMIIVTHLDDVARGRHREARQRSMEAGERPPSKELIFTSIAEEMVEKVREDLRTELRNSSSFQELDEADQGRRLAVVNSICDKLQVHCVAAPDAIELELGDEDEAFLRDLEATGVPKLRRAFVELAAEHSRERIERIDRSTKEFRKLLEESVARAERAYEEAPEVGLVNRFREMADSLLPELEVEMQGLHGRCMSRLSEGIPERIDQLCTAAELAGTQRMQSMRRHAEGLHYQSLNAALRRGGSWDNRGVDYPGGITRTFVEKIAGEWAKAVVDPVKETLLEVVEQDAGLVERMIELAQSAAPELIESAQVDGFVTSMREAAASCVPWSKQRLDDLRSRVESSLSDAVLEPIALACESAIEVGKNRGTGAKRRIIEVFEDSGTLALTDARKAASKLLRQLYGELYDDLNRDYLVVFDNPVRKVYEAITREVDRHEEEERRALELKVHEFAKAVRGKIAGIAA